MKPVATIGILAAAVLLSSCTDMAWVKQGVTEQTRTADQSACRQMAQREAGDLAWEHQFDTWWPEYRHPGTFSHPYRVLPYPWQWEYGEPFDYGLSLQNDTSRLTSFCMRVKGYTLAETDGKGKSGTR